MRGVAATGPELLRQPGGLQDLFHEVWVAVTGLLFRDVPPLDMADRSRAPASGQIMYSQQTPIRVVK